MLWWYAGKHQEPSGQIVTLSLDLANKMKIEMIELELLNSRWSQIMATFNVTNRIFQTIFWSPGLHFNSNQLILQSCRPSAVSWASRTTQQLTQRQGRGGLPFSQETRLSKYFSLLRLPVVVSHVSCQLTVRFNRNFIFCKIQSKFTS